ncbi:hypothetical protein P4H71_10970 [Paenibacillus kribbensis]|uniref:hypothetical protein n=1 Tax=Paenibacillus kribbensis TaxID=172713 RepID=UPI002DBA7254|nr:hypothetical protein [Paenibacillus kribbensis]MEC0234848.1 hypothetical protein [Paenibacillus kribbensis]
MEIINTSCNKLNDIQSKLNEEKLINQGLFLMSTTYFEATLRDVMNNILISKPKKLKKENFTISKNDLSSLDNFSILKSVIENELFNLFKGNVKDQLLYIMEIVTNIKASTLANKSKHRDIIDIITKCSDISYYRNCLIHNAGLKSKNFDESTQYYTTPNHKLDLSREIIKNFINDYLNFFDILKDKILSNSEFKQKTRLEQLRQLWNECFSSPILMFDDYWETNEERDLVVNVKYPDCEHGLSSSEKVYLSIWRHQFYDPIKTEEFLICSVDENKLYKIYKGLSEVKFYHMHQQARY